MQANLFNTWEGYQIIGNMMRLWGSRQSQDLSLEPVDRFLNKMASAKEALVSEWLRGHSGTVGVSVTLL